MCLLGDDLKVLYLSEPNTSIQLMIRSTEETIATFVSVNKQTEIPDNKSRLVVIVERDSCFFFSFYTF